MKALAFACLAALVLFAAPALAQTPAPTVTIQGSAIHGWIDLAFEVVTKIIVPLVATLAVGWASAKFGQKWSAETKDRVKNSVINILQAGLQREQAKLATANIEDKHVQASMVNGALAYAVNHGVERLKQAGIDPMSASGQQQVVEKLESMLAPLIMVGASSKNEVSVATAATIVNPDVATPPADVAIAAAKPAMPPVTVAQATADAEPPHN